MIKLFLDASVFIAGTKSLTGGSSFIIEACRRKIFKPVVTRVILKESEKNLQEKNPEHLARFYKIIGQLPLEIQPPALETKNYENIIHPKDAPVLAAAIESKSNFLITLDKKHFKTPKIERANLPLKILTPKEFLMSKEVEETIKELRKPPEGSKASGG